MRNRKVHVQFWLSEKEGEKLCKLVKRSGLSKEAYLRHLVDGLVPNDAPPPDYFRMMNALYDVGNELKSIKIRAAALGEIDAEKYDAAYKLFNKTVIDITNCVILPAKNLQLNSKI